MKETKKVLSERARSDNSHYLGNQRCLFIKPVSLGLGTVGWSFNEVTILSAAETAGLLDKDIYNLMTEPLARPKSVFLDLKKV
ncbi:hypothetical protein N8993_08080 [Pseudomonadales bacterium]|nr:hypothetical protein [Pseudomonadales bacterium]